MAKQPPQDPTENQDPPTPPSRDALPPGHLVLSEAEHNRLQAELRQANKRLAQIEEQRLARERDEKIEQERAAGRYDAAMAEERAARQKAEERAARLEKAQQLRDIITDRGLAGEKAAALRRLVDLEAEDIAAEVDATLAAFPNLFGAADPTPPPADPAAPPARAARRSGPTTPPAIGVQAGHKKLPEGFVTPEEYLDTPLATRYGPEFQKRVEASKPHWPKKIPARTFASSNE